MYRAEQQRRQEHEARYDEKLGEMYAVWGRISVQPGSPIAESVGVTKFQLEYNITHTILPEQETNTLEVLDSFIVLEGLDGAGTTTQASLLTARMQNAGHRVVPTSEPTHGAIGRLIREILAGRVETTPEALAMLYAADRHEHLYDPAQGIIRLLRDGWVVCDRYLFSSLAYQTVQCDYSLVYELNRRFPLPRHLVYVDVSPEMSGERRRERPATEIFENLEFQRAVYERYTRALADFAGSDMHVHILDGSAAPQDISEHIWKQLGIAPIN